MIRTCDDCQAVYDDALRLTYCPHDKLMSDSDMDRKIIAIGLLNQSSGKRVKFVDGFEFHPDFPVQPDGYLIQSMNWCGMISLEGIDGEFPPKLFEVIE